MEYIAKQLLHYKNQVDDLINGGYDISFLKSSNDYKEITQTKIMIILNIAVYGTEVIHIDEPEKNWEIYNHLEFIGLLPILRFLRLYIIDDFEDMARLKLSECVNFYLKEI